MALAVFIIFVACLIWHGDFQAQLQSSSFWAFLLQLKRFPEQIPFKQIPLIEYKIVLTPYFR